MATRTPADTPTPPECSEAQSVAHPSCQLSMQQSQGDPPIPPAIPPTDDAGTSGVTLGGGLLILMLVIFICSLCYCCMRKKTELKTPSYMRSCYAYPCSVDSGVTSIDMLQYIKTLWNNAKKYDSEVYAKKIIEVIPELKDVDDVFAIEWDELKEKFLQSATGKFYRAVETFPIDLTMMRQDYDMFTGFLECSPHYTNFTEESHNTQLRNLSGFLQGGCNADEVRILCIIGHGLSQQQAEELNKYPPEFDNKKCDDSTKMKSCRWKWPLTNCNDEEGLGKGYTARHVCETAKKGDVVVFASGFLTPEWIVEQLRKRELNKVNGKIPFTLVLLVDSCYSGEWTKRIEERIEELGDFQNTRLVVQTSCAADEGSYGQCFIPYWCAMQNVQGDQQFSDETLNCKQTPTLYDSDHNGGNGVGVLKFIPHGQSLQYFNYTLERGAHKDFINEFSNGEGKIHSYKLKHHMASGKPMAFFLVEINRRMVHLYVHFNIDLKVVTAINSYEAEKGKGYNYKYDEVGKKIEEKDQMTLEGILNRCQTHVKEAGHDQWDLKKPWRNGEKPWMMKNTQPPNVIRSRSVMFEMCNPHEL